MSSLRNKQKVDGVPALTFNLMCKELSRIDTKQNLQWFKKVFIKEREMPIKVWRLSKMREIWRSRLYEIIKKG